MILHRIQLRPRSPWRTPWQADTLLGLLCVTAARTRGTDFLKDRLLDPMRAGSPPFVVSDAFPGQLLPFPTVLRVADIPATADRKALKRARWLRRDDFLEARAGQVPAFGRWLPDPFQDDLRRHNTLGRDSDSSLEEGGLFARQERTWTRTTDPSERSLTIFARVRRDNDLDLLLELLLELALTGYGADVATGRGQFDLLGDAVPDPELDAPPPGSNGLVCLSTFQPAPGDPTDGFWEAFPKFGKLGPDLGVADVRVRKHTLILFRPGACFRAAAPRPFLGRELAMDLVLPPQTAETLRQRGIHILHLVYGLTIPARLPEFPSP